MSDPRISEICEPVLFASSSVFNYHKKSLNLNVNLQITKDLKRGFSKKPLLYNCIEGETKLSLGEASADAGNFAFESLKAACQALKDTHADVLLTAPINKDSIQSAEFQFPGHTEYLAHTFEAQHALMMLCGEHCKVALVTGHIPINEVASAISTEKILQKLTVANASLQQDFGIRKPKIAVLGLNPHAGDNGLLGKEEQEIIAPAIAQAKEKNILAYGPYPADGFWANGQAKAFDLVLAMYHDQGLIPFKSLEFENGVNFTAGLPVVRCSPDHGTAFDIAGKNEASEESFRAALFMAVDIYKKRNEQKALDKGKILS